MTDLLAKLEEAEEGSRDLDIDVGYACGDIPENWLRDFLPGDMPKPYTRSIDAALTLVTGLGSWRVGNTPSGGFAEIGTSQVEHVAKTPALALVIAALRSRTTGLERDRL